MRTLRTLVIGGLAAALLAACGGGGGTREFDAGSKSPDTPGTVQPATLELTKSAPNLTSDGRQTVRLFAILKDSGNVTVSGIPVSFRASGTGVTVSVTKATTDANGQAEATLSVSDPVNRTISVTADASGLSSSTSLDVVGTTVGVSGPASVVVNASAVFQVSVRDASGAPVVGKAVQVASAAGNQVSTSPSVTNAQGAVDLILTGTRAGADTLTVTSAGATGTRAVQVSSSSVVFDAPPSSSEIVVNSPPVPVRVRLLENGSPVVGAAIGFTATRGTLTSATALTDASGLATTTIQSPRAGRSLITATSPNGTIATREVAFVADRAAMIEVQAAPSTVGVNIGGAFSESSQIVAVVRDIADNPVKGARVNFSALDPSAGAGLSQTFALTDATGRAAVAFYPGAIPTGANQIIITAVIDCAYTVTGVQCAIPSSPPSDQTLLTASRRALQLRIGTGNEMRKIEETGAAPVFNEMPYGVLVTDSAGNAVPGVTLSAAVVGLDYRKGYWTNPCAPDKACWQQIVEGACLGEDLNLNLRLDLGEDLNNDGVLTPGNVAAAYFGPTGLATTGVSDAQGSSVLRIRYLRDRSEWASVRVRVSAALIDGTEGAEMTDFWLPVLASDLSSPIVAPPGQLMTVSPPGTVTPSSGSQSPYGRGSCP